MLKRSLSILTLNLLLIISGMSLGMSFGRLKEPLLEPKNSGDYSLVDVTESEAGAGRSMLSEAKTRSLLKNINGITDEYQVPFLI